MASKHHTNEETTSIDNLNEHLTSAGRFVEQKRKQIYAIIAVILIIGIGVVAYLMLYRQPKENKSYEEYANVEIKAMGNDSIALAEYMRVADKYSGNGGGNLAALSAGEALYAKGKYQEAVKYLDKFSTSESVLQANVYRLMGDCYVNLKKYQDALNYFDKAISCANGNPEITPVVLMKKAAVYDAQKQYDKAWECYETIQSENPDFTFGLSIDAYIERERARAGK
jgi:tetratricopeptide (TPR) repeat protein